MMSSTRVTSCCAGSLKATAQRGAPMGDARWSGETYVSEKRVNPNWTPTPEMRAENPDLPAYVPGGHPKNPLGVRAMYLGRSLYRIHGSNEPWTIGQAVSSGCIRMRNEDVIDLYNRTKENTVVVVLAPKQGSSLGTVAGGWNHLVYTATPGVPGDSGAAFLDAGGKALGTLSTVTIAPLAGSNGVSDLRRQLVFAQRHSGIAGLRLVRGTQEFAPAV